jgi:hypothetical protein
MQGNALLSLLPLAEATRLGAMLEPVDMPLRMNIERPGETPESFYFVDSGIVSVEACVVEAWVSERDETGATTLATLGRTLPCCS